ncbi:MAG: carboxypeptidase regulatory-like domain-containing protein [Anaerolineae bacterium]|nr:carboxypeptidase regulatory-like domain-containing protein [Anaerolineae bacterium]
MRSRWFNILVLLSLLLGTLPLTVEAAPAADPAASDPAAVGAQVAQKTVALRLSPEAYKATSDLTTLRVLDYGSFVWVVAPEATARALDARGVQYTFADTTIGIYDYKFDPLLGEPEVPTELRAPEGADVSGFYLVQFLGPVSDAWLTEMRATSLTPLQYYAHNAYLVWGKAQVVNSLRNRPYTRWTGALHPAYKLSPSLAQYKGKIENVAVTFYNDGKMDQTLEALKQLGEYQQHYATQPDGAFQTAILTMDAAQLDAVAKLPTVWAVEYSSPEPGIDDENANQIVSGQIGGDGRPVTGYYNWLAEKGVNGFGVTWADVDTGLYSGHPDITGDPAIFPGGTRVTTYVTYPGAPDAATDSEGHGSHTAGAIMADPVYGVQRIDPTAVKDSDGFYWGAGMAPSSTLVVQNALMGSSWPPAGGWNVLSKDTVTNGAVGSNNSWYTGVYNNSYTAACREHDFMVRDANFDTTSVAEPIIYVFSAGNGGPSAGTLSEPHASKNPIIVGASSNYPRSWASVDDLGDFSSRGPTADGRFNPMIVAPGDWTTSLVGNNRASCYGSYPPGEAGTYYHYCSGTSMSAPQVSGSSVLIVDWWRQEYGVTPSPAMVKALLVNGAEDMAGGNDGTGGVLAHVPNFNVGWGRVNLDNVIRTELPVVYADQEDVFANTGDTRSWTFVAADASEPIKITLAWTDAPGAVGANPALVNDLDLEVTSGGDTYMGNKLVNGVSVPGGVPDNLNNLENVFLPSGSSGMFNVTVRGANIAGDGVPYNGDLTDQDFALVCYNCYEEGVGFLDGVVYDSNGTPATDPLAGVSVSASNDSQIRRTTSGVDGYYWMGLVTDTYTVTARLYGYAINTLSPISVISGTTTTQNIPMVPGQYYAISGQVTDAVTGWPLYAKVSVVAGDPFMPPEAERSVWTDPVTGMYSFELAEGNVYTLQADAWADGYGPAQRVVGPLTTDVTENFALQPDMDTCAAPGYSIVGGLMAGFEDATFPPAGWTVVNNGGTCTWVGNDPGSDGNLTGGSGKFADADSDSCGSGTTMNTDLISPPFDVSGLSQINLSFAYDYYNLSSSEVVAVDVSANNGATWTNIVTWNSSHRGPATFSQDVTSLLAGATQARVRFHYYAPGWDWWLQVDDVLLGNPVCQVPTGGGLVVGNVYDENSPTMALNGATVASAVGDETTTMATPDDAALDDGFYTLYAPSGAQMLTAAMDGGYGVDTATATVPDGDVVQQNFFLPAGSLTYTPAGLAATVELGFVATADLNISNVGSLGASFTLGEVPGGFAPVGTLMMRSQAKQDGADVAPTSLLALPVTPLAVGDPVLQLPLDGVTMDSQNLGVEFALGYWWVTGGGSNSDPNKLYKLNPDGTLVATYDQPASVTGWGWRDLAFDGEYLYASGSATVDQIDPDTGMATGVTIACPTNPCRALAYDPDTDHFWTANFNSSIWEFDRTGTIIHTFPNALSAYGMAWDSWSADGPFLWVWSQDGSPAVLATQIDPATGTPTGVAFQGFDGGWTDNIAGGATISPGVLPGQLTFFGLHQADTDMIIGYDLDVAVSWDAVPWLFEDPDAGSVSVAGSAPIAVTFDAAYVTQPGEYYAQLQIASDTPYDIPAIPVTMTVTPPHSWGKVTGTVTGLGVCDGDPAPLEKAEVLLESATTGQSWLLETGANGVYQLWADQANSPLTITVTAPDYYGQATGVVVAQGATTVENFDLRLLKPCLSYNPADFDVTLAMGNNTDELLTLSNTGAGDVTFELMEVAGDFMPMQSVVQSLVASRLNVVRQPLAGVPQSLAEFIASGLPAPEVQPMAPSLPTGVMQGVDLYYDRQDFNADYPDLPVEDYENGSMPPAALDVIPHPLDASSSNAYFDPGDILPGIQFWATNDEGGEELVVLGAGFQSNPSKTAAANYFSDGYRVVFDPPVQAAGMDLQEFMGSYSCQVDIYDSTGSLLGTDVSTCNEAGVFWGVASMSNPIAEIVVTSLGGGAQGVDNVAFGNKAGGIPWLSENPISSTIAADTDGMVDLTFDAGVPETMQPGTYYGALKVKSNAANDVANIPVTLTVTPPPTWGKIAGVVTGLGYCDVATPTLLEEAEVTIESRTGLVDWMVMTNEDGEYQFWLDAAHSPVTITVAYPDHVTQVIPGVSVVAGGTTTRNAALRWAQPCFSVDPDLFDVTVTLGMSTTLPLSLMNDGGVAASFAVEEENGGFVSAAPVLWAPVAPVVTGVSNPDWAEKGVPSGTPVVGAPVIGAAPEDIGDAWETMAPLPSARVFNAVVADTNGYVYVIGGTSDASGSVATNTNFRYDTDADSWDTMAAMPASLSNIDGIVVHGKIYIPGDATTANTFVYDIASDSWTTIAANGGYTARSQYQVVAIGTDLYVLGGIVASSSASTTEVWILDTTSGTWSAGVSMQKSRTSFSAAAINGEIYVAGGVAFPGFTPDMTSEKFNGTTWSYIANVPNGGGAYTRWSYNADGLSPDGLWLAAGRRDADWAVLNHAGYYNPDTDTWMDSPTIPALAQGRVYMEGDVASDGYFYVIGGRDSAASVVYATNERLEVGYAGTVIGGDIPWLSEDPTSGAVNADSTSVVALTFDATDAVTQVTQPGKYFGDLYVTSNDPFNKKVVVPVTLTVEPPATWGKLMGTVTGLGYCNADPAPLVGLDVLIEGSSGMTWTVTTNVSGTYQLWLDEGESPITITVEAPEHEKGEATVTVNAGATTTQNFNLHWFVPCVQADPSALHVTLDLGTTATDQFDLDNAGFAGTDWELTEVNLGALTVTPPSVSTVVLLSEDFDSVTTPALPTNWQTVVVTSTDSPAWASNAGTNHPSGQPAHSGANLVYFNAYNVHSGGSARLWYTLTLSGMNTLTYWMYHDTGYSSTSDRLQVQVSTDGGTTWMNVGPEVLRYRATAGWAQETVDLSAYEAQPSVLIGFLAISAYGNDIHIDDVVVSNVSNDPVIWLDESPTSGSLAAEIGNDTLDVDFDASVVDQPGDYVANLEIASDDPESPLVLPVTMTVTAPASWGHLVGTVSTLGHCDVMTAPLAGAQVVIELSGVPVVTLTTGADGMYGYWLPNGNYDVIVSAADHTGDSAAVAVTAGGTITQNFALTWLGPCVSIEPSVMEVTVALGVSTTVPLTIENAGAGVATYQMQEFPGGFVPTLMQRAPLSGSPLRLGTPKPLEGPRPTPVLLGGGVVADGGFEAGPDGGIWNEYSLNFGTPVCDVAGCGTGMGTGPRTGDYWTWFGGIDEYEDGSMDQDVVIPVGMKSLVFWVEQVMCDSADDYLEVTLDSTPVFYTDGGDSVCGVLGYRQVVIDITAFADGGSHNLMFASETFATNGDVSNFFVDDVSILPGIPWLSENPESGNVAASGSAAVSVVFDASVPEVAQPGTYAGTLTVANDDPVLSGFAIPVTMHVTLPASYGQITGTVMGLGPCDDPMTAMPLSGAEVVVSSATGSWMVLTGADGSYSLWIDSAHSPVTVTASAGGYLAQTTTGVVMTAGGMATANFSLTPELPCIGVEPADLHVTLAMGVSTTLPITVSNSGAALLDWKVQESDGGFMMLAPVPLATGGPDPFGYTFADSAESAGPRFSWIDATDGMASGVTDDGEASITLPFSFNFYGVDSTDIRVGNNGGVLFGVTSGDLYAGNDALASTSTNNIIAVFWDDIDDETGNVYYKTVGTAPNRKFVIEWYNRPHYNNVGNGTFEMILFEGTNSILFQYADLDYGNTLYDYGASATVGIRQSGSNYLQYSYNTSSLSDGLAICFAYPGQAPNCGGGVPWVDEDPTSGTVAMGASEQVTVTFDASVPEVTQPGDYYATLTFKGAGVERPMPVTMTVQAPATWGKLTGMVNGLGYCDEDPMPLEGAMVFIESGTGMSWTLETGADGMYGVWFDASYNPVTVTVAYEAGYGEQVFTGVAVTAGNITTLNADLAWLQPCVTVSPEALNFAVPMGTSTSVALTLANAGAADSEYQVEERSLGFTPLAVMAVGGPDNFGYRYADSNGGATRYPTYDFVDIAGVNAPLALGNNAFQEVAIGFPFKFYGDSALDPDTYNTLFVNSNGFLSFGAGSSDFTPDPLPSPTLPDNLIAVAWDHLSLGATGAVYAQSFAQCPYNPDGTSVDACFIVQYDNVVHADGTPAGTFEVILFRTGSILMQYEDVAAPQATTGLEAPLGLDGLNYAPALADNLAICFAYPGEWLNCQSVQVPWLNVAPNEGDLVAYDDATLNVTLDASVPEVAAPGTYMALLDVYSDDPFNPITTIPVTMTVAMPSTLGKMWGTVYAFGQCDAVSTTMANAMVTVQAADGRAWMAHTDANGNYGLWLPADEVVTMTVAAEGYAFVSMVDTVESGVMPAHDVELHAYMPCVSMTPNSFDVALPLNRVATRTLTIHNTGAAPFDYSNIAGLSMWLSVGSKTGSVPAHSSVDVTLVFNSMGLMAGDVYSTVLEVAHLDPAIGRLFVRPVRLTVTDEPTVLVDVVKLSTPATYVLAGERITYTVIFTNSYDQPLVLTATDAIPANTTYAVGTVSNGAIYGEDPVPSVVWTGSLDASAMAMFSFSVQVGAGVPTDTQILNMVSIEAMGQVFTATKTVTVSEEEEPPVVVEVTKTSVPGTYVRPGGLITYTVSFTNRYIQPLALTATDPVPANTTYVAGSATGGATYNATPAPSVVWSGMLGVNETATFSFAVQVGASVPTDTQIVNTVTVVGGGAIFTASKTVTVSEEVEPQNVIYLPLVTRSYSPAP